MDHFSLDKASSRAKPINVAAHPAGRHARRPASLTRDLKGHLSLGSVLLSVGCEQGGAGDSSGCSTSVQHSAASLADRRASATLIRVYERVKVA